MKNLREMTIKQIKEYMKENNMCIDKAYKMRKEELIVAIENGIAEGKLFDPDKKYLFSKEKYLEKIERKLGKGVKENVLQDKEMMDWLDRIDGQEVKQNRWAANTVYVEDRDYETFRRDVCIEELEKHVLIHKDENKKNNSTKEDPAPADKNTEVKVDATILTLMPDGVPVTVKVKDFKNKNEYFRTDKGVLVTDRLTGYKAVKIKNRYRTRHVAVANSNKNIDFFVSKKDFINFQNKIYEKEKKSKKTII